MVEFGIFAMDEDESSFVGNYSMPSAVAAAIDQCEKGPAVLSSSSSEDENDKSSKSMARTFGGCPGAGAVHLPLSPTTTPMTPKTKAAAQVFISETFLPHQVLEVFGSLTRCETFLERVDPQYAHEILAGICALGTDDKRSIRVCTTPPNTPERTSTSRRSSSVDSFSNPSTLSSPDA